MNKKTTTNRTNLHLEINGTTEFRRVDYTPKHAAAADCVTYSLCNTTNRQDNKEAANLCRILIEKIEVKCS